jgi:hypothetical protein
MKHNLRSVVWLGVALLGQPVLSEESGGQSLAQAANDPTAALTAYQFQDSYSPSVYNTGGASQNFLQFRAAIPFEIAGLQNIFRVTLPY